MCNKQFPFSLAIHTNFNPKNNDQYSKNTICRYTISKRLLSCAKMTSRQIPMSVTRLALQNYILSVRIFETVFETLKLVNHSTNITKFNKINKVINSRLVIYFCCLFYLFHQENDTSILEYLSNTLLREFMYL